MHSTRIGVDDYNHATIDSYSACTYVSDYHNNNKIIITPGIADQYS